MRCEGITSVVLLTVMEKSFCTHVLSLLPIARYRRQVEPIHRQITPPSDDNTVRYLHLSEIPGQYSMGIFVFPPYARIPLHDHPGMCVLSRVLYGSLHRRSLDLAREDEENNDGSNSPTSATSHKNSSWISSHFMWRNKHATETTPSYPWGSKRAFENRVDILTAPDTTILYPHEGNLHEFAAGPQGAAVLDILLPPYDESHHRDCTFYEIRYDAFSQQEQSSSKDAHKEGRPCWIIPTCQPEDFHCTSGAYRELGEEPPSST